LPPGTGPAELASLDTVEILDRAREWDAVVVAAHVRVEVVSPGRLPNGVTPERMLVGIRAARNQLLKDVLRDYGYLEHMGMGVPRTVVRGMRAHNCTEPVLTEDGERFTVTSCGSACRAARTS